MKDAYFLHAFLNFKMLILLNEEENYDVRFSKFLSIHVYIPLEHVRKLSACKKQTRLNVAETDQQ